MLRSAELSSGSVCYALQANCPNNKKESQNQGSNNKFDGGMNKCSKPSKRIEVAFTAWIQFPVNADCQRYRTLKLLARLAVASAKAIYYDSTMTWARLREQTRSSTWPACATTPGHVKDENHPATLEQLLLMDL